MHDPAWEPRLPVLHIYGADPTSYVDGLDASARLIAEYVNPSPVLLRTAAALIMNNATTLLELGLAAGLRIHASELDDDDAERWYGVTRESVA